jgi:hypothetical protein
MNNKRKMKKKKESEPSLGSVHSLAILFNNPITPQTILKARTSISIAVKCRSSDALELEKILELGC